MTADELFDSLLRLHRDVDRETRPLAERQVARLRCERGCSACCVDDITVFEIEAERIRREHPELLASGAPHPVGGCAFLDSDGACRVYDARPYVCRTQGLPLRWIDADDPEHPVELRDICPLNEREDEPLTELDCEDCWTLGPWEGRLAELARQATGDEPRRIRLRDLFRRAAPLALLAALLSGGCASGDRPSPTDGWLVDVTSSVGLPGEAARLPDGTFLLPEIMGPGVALLDYDGDDDLDILNLVTPPPGTTDLPAPNRLYARDSDGTYRDVTAASGLGDEGFAQGVAVGDVDNDGDDDVFLANYGADRLYLNNGQGRFAEEGRARGITDDAWSSSATFCDYDRDGDLDLYVARYLRYDASTVCFSESGGQDYCSPQSFYGEPDTLYRNDGGGRFSDVTAAAGVVLPDRGRQAKGLGVVCLDLTGDDWPDFYVANDGEPNQLWVNRGDGTFRDEAALRGVAVSGEGRAQAGMGIGVGDALGRGSVDLYVTHLANEHNALYLAGERGLFADAAFDSGLARLDLQMTGFGCGFLDVELDGDLDLAIANGRVYIGPPMADTGLGPFWSRLAEPDMLLLNLGSPGPLGSPGSSGRFEDAGERAGDFGRHVGISRGLALGDLDQDGDVDLVVSAIDGSLRVYRNEAPRENRHWLSLRLVTAGRDALGAVATVELESDSKMGVALPGQGYMSSGDPRVHLGLGDAERYLGLEVRWPDGRRERFPGGDVDRRLTLVQGTGAGG